MAKRLKKSKFGSRIIFITLLVSLVSGLLVGVVSVKYMQDHLLAISRNHMKSLVQIAASSLDGDLLDSIGTEDMWSDSYCQVYNQLQRYLSDENVEYIYTMRKNGDTVEFLVDGDVNEPSPVGEVYPSYDKISEAFSGQVTLDDHVTADQWGDYYSAFAPVYNHAGQIVAIVGIDSTVDNIHMRTRQMLRSLVAIEAICIMICTGLSVVAARRMTQYVEEASKDSLTGMYNRRYAIRYMDDAMNEYETFGFLLMDIDFFKKVNDTYGHRVGDRILMGLAHIIQESLGKEDIGFRLGGDEFAAFFPGEITEHQLSDRVQKIQHQFDQLLQVNCPDIPEAGISLGAVIGMEKTPFSEIYHAADSLLYQVKNEGRGHCEVRVLPHSGDDN